MTVKELRNILKNFDDDLTVITKKVNPVFVGDVGVVNSVRKDTFCFMLFDLPCVLLTDELPEEKEEKE